LDASWWLDAAEVFPSQRFRTGSEAKRMTTGLVVLGGLLIGVVSGLIGIGGGILIVPMLVYFLDMGQKRAQGTSLAALLLPIGIFAAWEYYKAGNVDIRIALILAGTIAIGAWFGAMFAQQISESALRRGFAVLLVFAALRLFFKK
jgi:uncharacterized membrane protein YfcA